MRDYSTPRASLNVNIPAELRDQLDYLHYRRRRTVTAIIVEMLERELNVARVNGELNGFVGRRA